MHLLYSGNERGSGKEKEGQTALPRQMSRIIFQFYKGMASLKETLREICFSC